MNVFTSKFQMAMMEANALIPLFTFTSKVEENSHSAKENYVNLVDSIVAMIRIIYILILFHLELQLEVAPQYF